MTRRATAVLWSTGSHRSLITELSTLTYMNVTPKWMVECIAPHITTYLRAIPMETFMNLQSCDYSGYLERWPELRAFDFSSITASDFLEHMPPGMMMDILRATREQRAASAAATD